jgi:CxxC-x17-CxxC domain-containing protein
MEFRNQIRTCVDCGVEFIFTAGEQSFFYDKSFKHAPRRCKACKAKRISAEGPGSRTVLLRLTRAVTSAICAQCGTETTVPFRPTQGRPVFCRECFRNRRAQAAGA